MNRTVAFSIGIAIHFSINMAWAQNAQDDSQVMEVIPDHLAYLYSIPLKRDGNNTDDVNKLRQLVANNRRWENGRELRVCFYNANPVVATLVRKIASEWNGFSGVTFTFGEDGKWLNCLDPKVGFPEIRIGFNERGYWSYLGSDSERYGGERAPSMNFESFNRIYNELKYSVGDVVLRSDSYHKATIRHEFGHALGLLHEHQNVNLDCYSEIKWSGVGNVYDYFAGPNNFWSKEQVDRNLGFIGATDPDYVAGDADSESIMMYSLPASIFINGAKSKCAVSVNREISSGDRRIVAKMYPRASADQPVSLIAENIESAFIKPAPQFSSERESADYLKLATIDLESNDTATRRNARARLAQILAENTAVEETNRLVRNVEGGSYRYKLGVASALSKAGNKVELPKETVDLLSSQHAKEEDKTLKDALKAAKKNIEVQ